MVLEQWSAGQFLLATTACRQQRKEGEHSHHTPLAFQRSQGCSEGKLEAAIPPRSLARARPLQAIAWCPWEGSKVLATGGGHSDGYLRFWNNSNGTCQQAIKTDSQVRAHEK